MPGKEKEEMEMKEEFKASSVIDKYGRLYFDICFKKGEQITEKRVEPQKLAEILLGSIREEMRFIEIPQVPSCVKKARIATDGRPDSFEAVMVYPAQKRGFSFMGNLFFIPFPTLVMKVTYVKGVRKEVVIFALDTDEPTSESKLFHYPYGNVRESGSICFGNITLKVKDIADAPKVFDDFLCGKTNNDLYHTQNTRGFSQGELVSYVENLEVYPKELLLKNGKTFGDL